MQHAKHPLMLERDQDDIIPYEEFEDYNPEDPLGDGLGFDDVYLPVLNDDDLFDDIDDSDDEYYDACEYDQGIIDTVNEINAERLQYEDFTGDGLAPIVGG